MEKTGVKKRALITPIASLVLLFIVRHATPENWDKPGMIAVLVARKVANQLLSAISPELVAYGFLGLAIIGGLLFLYYHNKKLLPAKMMNNIFSTREELDEEPADEYEYSKEGML